MISIHWFEQKAASGSVKLRGNLLQWAAPGRMPCRHINQTYRSISEQEIARHNFHKSINHDQSTNRYKKDRYRYLNRYRYSLVIYIAIENCHWNSEFSLKNGGSFHSYVNVYQAGYTEYTPTAYIKRTHDSLVFLHLHPLQPPASPAEIG